MVREGVTEKVGGGSLQMHWRLCAGQGDSKGAGVSLGQWLQWRGMKEEGRGHGRPDHIRPVDHRLIFWVKWKVLEGLAREVT